METIGGDLRQMQRTPRAALFIMVGAAPNTEWLSGLVKLDDKGFVITGSGAASPGPSLRRCPAFSR